MVTAKEQVEVQRPSEGVAAHASAPLNVGYLVECYVTFIVEEIRALRQLGVEVTVFNAFRPEPEPDPAREALRRESLYFPPGYRGVAGANLRCFGRRPLTYLRLARFLRQEGESWRLLLLAAYYSQLVLRRGIKHLHGTFGTRTTTLAYLTAQLAGIDYSFTTHAYDIFHPNPSLVWKTNQARFMRVISQFNQRYIAETYPGVDGSKLRLGYLGVDPDKFQPQGPRSSSPAKYQIISIGDLIWQKGHLYLIRACGLLAQQGIDFECRIIGDGPYYQELLTEIARLGLTDQVQLLGAQDNKTVRQYLNEADIFALACIDLRGEGEHIDGIPVVLMEAMAMELPVVSTKISGIPELIEDGHSGLLVPEKDEQALAQALTQLLMDRSLRGGLGQAARQRIIDHFDLVANTRQLALLFQGAAANHHFGRQV